jgi:hypothetical protein
MYTTTRAQVRRIERYLEEISKKNLKPHHEIVLSELSGLMNKIGFNGPEYKGGAVIGFSHKLLESASYLTGGQFTIHITHTGGNQEKIRYRDFKEYVLPHIKEVLVLLEEQNLISEEENNVQL